jgi:hypothetical protein
VRVVASIEQILGTLDRAAEAQRFAYLGHPYSYLAAARLHAYSDADRWALAIETAGYNPRAANLVDVLYVFGNCVTNDGAVAHLRRIDNVPDIVDDAGLCLTSAPIHIRGRAITPAAAPGERPWELVRRLMPEHRDLVLATEEELRAWLPPDLPKVLRLDDWHHTDMTARPPSPERDRQRRLHQMLASRSSNPVPFETYPSDTETYRQLATVLATGNPHAYQPTTAPNTHWSNWPEAGSL